MKNVKKVHSTKISVDTNLISYHLKTFKFCLLKLWSSVAFFHSESKIWFVFIPRNVGVNYYQLSSTIHIYLMSMACNNSLRKSRRIVNFCQIVSKVFHPRIVQTCPEHILVHSKEPYDLRWKRYVNWLLSISCY